MPCPGEEDMLRGESMEKQVDIKVRNKLVKEKRDINVYHHFDRTSHIISCNSSLTRPVKPKDAGDYLHISAVSGPGYLENDCVMDLPSFMNFRFRTTGEVTLDFSGDRTILKIPPGPPAWELIVSVSKRLPASEPFAGDHITIGNAGEWPDSSFRGEGRDIK
jgi:hypothetical protein